MLLSDAATDRQDLPADPLQPPRSIVYFAYIISDYFKSPPPDRRHQFRYSKCAQQTFIYGSALTFGRMMVYFNTVFHSFFLPFPMMPWKAAIIIKENFLHLRFLLLINFSLYFANHQPFQKTYICTPGRWTEWSEDKILVSHTWYVAPLSSASTLSLLSCPLVSEHNTEMDVRSKDTAKKVLG